MQRKGRFELADRGTLFLDEIGDISLELQPKLLRAVQEQEFERLGTAATIQVNVRMIAATHRDLRAMIQDEKFREDLFYRFNVFPIEIPCGPQKPRAAVEMHGVRCIWPEFSYVVFSSWRRLCEAEWACSRPI